MNLENLWKKGKRLLLVDVDNTLVQWRQENFSPEVLAWIAKAKQMGFEICIISNTNRVERLERLRQLLGVETVRGRFKPSRAMFRLALIKFKRKAEEAVMIGDQIFTDVLGANRAGIDAVWVRKMEGQEFGPTSISRMGERLLQGALYKALITPIDEKVATPKELPLKEKPIFRQFVKFCIVGGLSFLIDYCIRMTLLFAIPYEGGLLSDVVGRYLIHSMPAIFGFAKTPYDAAYPVAATISSSVAILNSFFWNRLWTFSIRGKHERVAQLQRFVVVSVIAQVMNVLISSFFNHHLPFDDKWNGRLALVIASVIIAIWNFTGQRLYAFRSKKPVEPAV